MEREDSEASEPRFLRKFSISEVLNSHVFFVEILSLVGIVIATASRPETVDWCKKFGADHVIDHKKELKPQLERLGVKEGVDVIFCATEPKHTEKEWPSIIKPFGKIVIVTGGHTVSTEPYVGMSVSIIHEGMFAKSTYGVNLESQGEILRQAAELVEKAILLPTNNYQFPLDQVAKAHQLQDSGTAIGKITLTF